MLAYSKPTSGMNVMNSFMQHTREADDFDAAKMLALYDISEEHLSQVRTYGQSILPLKEQWVGAWYEWLGTQPEFEIYFSDKEALERVQRLQLQYWEEFFSADVSDNYLKQRRIVGETHARIGLPLHTYFSGMNKFMDLFADLTSELELSSKQSGYSSGLRAVSKLVTLDTALVVDAYSRIVEETVSAQSKALMELSTPVTQIWTDILLLPLVGIIDSHRARDIMNTTLAKISDTRARIFILDISGVGVVDTAVANNLIKITKATSLMGCECTISGVSPAIAQTIVELGIDTGNIKTTSTMRDALANAFQRLGMEIREGT
jgi:rsbT co-antagonist protein RsbR